MPSIPPPPRSTRPAALPRRGQRAARGVVERGRCAGRAHRAREGGERGAARAGGRASRARRHELAHLVQAPLLGLPRAAREASGQAAHGPLEGGAAGAREARTHRPARGGRRRGSSLLPARALPLRGRCRSRRRAALPSSGVRSARGAGARHRTPAVRRGCVPGAASVISRAPRARSPPDRWGRG